MNLRLDHEEASEYAPVTGINAQEKQQLRALESKAAAKTARDYQHVIWAYGLLWAIFAVYGLFLWRRTQRLRADVHKLQAQLINSERP